MSEKTRTRLALLLTTAPIALAFVWANVVTFIAPMTEAQVWSACYSDNTWAMHQCMLRKSDGAILAFFVALAFDIGAVIFLASLLRRWLRPVTWLILRWISIGMAYTRVHLRPVRA